MKQTNIYCPPYEILYIYYIQGKVKALSEKQLFLSHYIGNWVEADTSFLFFTCESREKIDQLMAIQPELILLDSFQMTYQEWCGGQFEVISLADFIIAPPWMHKISEIDPRPIWLDPGVVFGAGTHPTTYDCLQAIDAAFSLYSIETMVDIGTGTGLLSLFGARKGAQRIVALDLNPLAVQTTQNNIQINDLDKHIFAVQADASHLVTKSVDLWVANIHFDVLISLVQSPEFIRHKLFVISGLMYSESLIIKDLLSKLPVKIIQSWEGTWFTCLGATI
ncbi:MAG: ribosomal L11 methyltransferase [Candidatus Magnetoglobus multicellularis str. Araruama]|uniref:Ribosomal L11 methyltransferase n=1 Tax=Candidatus Magnetoglobus multicellularis str. Araruama TaxID=890399 RepID=A0A1V1P9A6_9BACT|nr:MAG: ribosomal L11 methyltransferase [Candidatus Magnetoglobus multicellularis str. Araruama]